ncbi:FAD-linked oxidase [Amycolatopsis orientalis]|uniref:FAD-linked oxidase n=1 Tax=Amycolatopsis orientalis TaxID=31958 RepID=A0A193BUN6_AMYOR|nr:BBE domain-containing protein [Amycolatopsis orientalis]ANN15893.1 FAD-linked oxidase [Amycolatopsis orientalis]
MTAFTTSAVVPGDPRYEDLIRRGHNPRFAHRPDEVHPVRSTDEVVRVVADAVRAGRRIAVRSGGHCGEDLVDNPAVQVLIDISQMSHVDFDHERRAFMVEAGATMEQVYRTLYFGWGVTVPGGVCLSVGAGGHFGGGGFGALSRSLGTVAEYIEAVEVVVVDDEGEARAVVATRDPKDPHHDLWWAHTGAGSGSFGVVTRYWLRSATAADEAPARSLPAPPSAIQCDLVMWDWPDLAAQDVFVRFMANHGKWSERNSDPDSAATALHSVLMIPHQAAGKIVLDVQTDASAPGAEKLADDLVDALASGVAEPSLRIRAVRSWWQGMLATTVSKDPIPQDAQSRAKVKSGYLRRSFTDDQFATVHAHLTTADYAHPEAYLCLVSYGGRVNAVAPTATSLAQRDSVLKVLFGVNWTQPDEDDSHLRWVREFYRDVYRETGGVPVPGEVSDGAYINYADADLADPVWNTSGVPWHALYHKENYARLQRVKARWDPNDVFRHRLSVHATAEESS